MSRFEIDDYVVADFSETCKGATDLRAVVEVIAPLVGTRSGEEPRQRYLVRTADLRSNGQQAWLDESQLSSPPDSEEALFEFVVGDRAMAVANLDDAGSSPLFLDEVKTLSDQRTNRYRAPLRVAYEVLFLLEGCPACGGSAGGYGGDPAETHAVRQAAKKLRHGIEKFYEAERKNRLRDNARRRSSDGMTPSESAMANSEEEFLATRPVERFARARKRESEKDAVPVECRECGWSSRRKLPTSLRCPVCGELGVRTVL